MKKYLFTVKFDDFETQISVNENYNNRPDVLALAIDRIFKDLMIQGAIKTPTSFSVKGEKTE